MKGLQNLTPKEFQCTMSSCPGVFQDEKTGELFIQGQKVDAAEFGINLGKGEVLIKVPKEIFQNLK